MKDIYTKIWKLAKPYYEKGRPMDVDHIEWMTKAALEVSEKENLDDSLLLPLVILHDVGYAEVPKDNPFNKDIRKAHMKAGTNITRRILKEVGYPQDKIEKIVYYVSVHDNWALGNDKIYKEDIILGVFTDLDFIWMATPKGFPALLKILKKSAPELIGYLETDEKHIKRPFFTRTTKNMYIKYLDDRKKEVLGT